MELEEKLFPLSAILEIYREGLIDKREFEERILRYFIKNYKIYCPHINKPEFMDFLSWVYPRLSKAITRYKDSGSSFDAFLGTILRYGFREFFTLQKDRSKIESTFIKSVEEDRDNLFVSEQDNFYDKEIDFLNTPLRQKHTLILLLKSYYHLTDDLIEKIIPSLKIDKSTLLELINKLHYIRREKEAFVRRLLTSINCQFFRCRTYESKLLYCEENSKLYIKYNMLLNRGRLRIERMRNRLKRIRLYATNEEVALVLNVPKGTVDSSMAKIKGSDGAICFYATKSINMCQN
ncbi:MAG: hypothetical protein Ta2F_15730 [Termitinemataceae bacterium]|nr:MAG: hypothetical protein Ta2F_15730 [Termitinemataceae bacterium]